jgi:hypothetical protein
LNYRDIFKPQTGIFPMDAEIYYAFLYDFQKEVFPEKLFRSTYDFISFVKNDGKFDTFL